MLRIKLKLIFIIMKNDIAINSFSSILPHVYVMSPDSVARSIQLSICMQGDAASSLTV